MPRVKRREERVAASGANWPGLVWRPHCHREIGGGVCGGRPGGGLEGLAGGGRAWRGGRRGRRGRRGRGRAAAGAARRRPGPETRVSVGVQAEKEWLGSNFSSLIIISRFACADHVE